VHLREAPYEEAGVGLGDEVVGFEPGHLHGAALPVGHRAKAHEGVHLVHVARHGAHHVVGLHAVGVERVVAQRALVRQAPQQPVHQRKARRVAVQHQAFAQAQKILGHPRRRASCLAWQRIQGLARWCGRCEQVLRRALRGEPFHLLRRHAGLHQRACRLAKARPVGGVCEGDGVQGHGGLPQSKRRRCAGGGAMLAARSVASSVRPGR